MRRSSRLAAVASRIGPDAATLTSLPLLLAQRIFLALPPDARGRACCVCRAWRDTLADPSLWTRLDLSAVREFAVVERPRFVFLLRGAARRARGQLCLLDLSQHYLELHWFLPVLTANAGSLRELRLHSMCADDVHYLDPQEDPTVEKVVAAAPLLQVLTSESVSCKWQNAVRFLRGEPQFALLQCRKLTVWCANEFESYGGMARVGPFAAALADASLRPALLHVCVFMADTAQPAVVGALVDAAVARRMPELKFMGGTRPAAAPLARLLAEGSLSYFGMAPGGYPRTPLFDAAGAALVAGALRINTTLTSLELSGANLCLDMGAAALLLGALVGHRSIRELQITGEEHTTTEASFVFGAALAALIAADAPTLHVLVCFNNHLGDGYLTSIVEALALNRHLRTLDVSDNGMSEAFARDRLLPAVRANTTLRELKCAKYQPGPPSAAEAEELVRRRWQHD
jgi:hypothetical protein